MRVLVLTNMYPPHHYGGYELNCQEIVTSFRDAGDDVLVLTSDVTVPGVDPPREARDDVRRDLHLYWRDHVLLSPSLAGCLRIERHNQRALRDAIDAHRPDVVSVWHMGAMSLHLLVTCARAGLPLIHVVNDDWLVYGPVVDRWARVWRRAGTAATVGDLMLRLPCRLPDLGGLGTFCFISETTRRAARDHGGWHFDDTTVSYCGINVDHFPIGAAPARPSWSWRLLHVGRVDDRKGIDTAIRTLALLPAEATLEILGRGDDAYLAELRALADRLGVAGRVTFDVVGRERLAARYAAADVLLFPPRWAEPFGLVPLEAMACSTPVVATATGGSSEFLVDAANCLRVPVDDHDATAAAVLRLSRDAGLRARVVDGGLATARELTLPRWAATLREWHEAAAARFPHGRPLDREPIVDVLDRCLPHP